MISTLPFAGQTFAVNLDANEPLMIESFNASKDALQLAGTLAEYATETVDGNLEISTLGGKLLATVKGISELKPYTGNNPEGETYLLSLENEFFEQNIEPAFFEPYYPIQNPDVVELVESGQYASYYDHFFKAGQFEPREDTFFQGTEGDDTLYSIGYENILVGVPITGADYINGLDVVPVNTGTGQVDTLIGNGINQKETIFVLGNGTLLNETAQTFYLGEGDADYALIENFQNRDRIFLGSDVSEFTLETIDGDVHISKAGDLVAIVENRTELLSARENELAAPQIEFFTPGTAGNDTLYSAVRQNYLVGVEISAGQVIGKTYPDVVPVSTGVGEVDTLYGLSGREDTFLLGTSGLLNETAQPFYVGQGDADYALIKDFSANDEYDTVILAGEVSDYKFEIQAYDGTGDDTKIYTKKGDLIAIVEGATLSQAYENDNGKSLTLYASNLNGSAEAAAEYFSDVEPVFYEDFYLDKNPEVAALISSGEFGSAFEHYLEVGQFTEEGEIILTGTSGNDSLYGIGKSDLLFGVPLTSVDSETEGWTSSSTGVGEQDTLGGGLGVTTFFIGNDQILDPSKPSEVYYVGKGDEDYALIQGFQPTQDFIFAAGAIADYTLETVDGDVKISYGGDLVAIVDDIGDLALQEFSFGDERPNAFAFVAPQNKFLPTEPTEPTVSEPLFGTTGDDTLALTAANLVFAGAGNDLVDAVTGQGNNRIYGGSGKDTFILGSSDSLMGDIGDDRFFAQTGGDNALTGGAGADQFWITSADIPESANTITDFTSGEDVIGLAGLGASFSSLTLTQQGDNALISFNEKDLAVLNQIQSSSLSAANGYQLKPGQRLRIRASSAVV